MPRHARVLLLSVGVLALGAAGCASVPAGSVAAAAVQCPEDSDCYDVPRAIGEGGSFSIQAREFAFENLEGTYWAGDIEVTLDNVGGAEHNIVIIGANEGSQVPVQALGGESTTGTVNLFEGDYIYYCSIPGHRAQGMEGELTVFATEDEAAQNLDGAGQGGSEQPSGDPTSPSPSGSESASPSPADSGSATEG